MESAQKCQWKMVSRQIKSNSCPAFLNKNTPAGNRNGEMSKLNWQTRLMRAIKLSMPIRHWTSFSSFHADAYHTYAQSLENGLGVSITWPCPSDLRTNLDVVLARKYFYATPAKCCYKSHFTWHGALEEIYICTYIHMHMCIEVSMWNAGSATAKGVMHLPSFNRCMWMFLLLVLWLWSNKFLWILAFPFYEFAQQCVIIFNGTSGFLYWNLVATGASYCISSTLWL